MTVKIKIFILLCFVLFKLEAQDLSIRANVEKITLIPGETFQIEALVQDSEGKKVDNSEMYFYTSGGKFANTNDKGLLEAYEPGDARVIIIARVVDYKDRLRLDIPVTINYADPSEITISDLPTELFVGQVVTMNVEVIDKKGFTIKDSPDFNSSKPDVISVDEFGNISALKKGNADIIASSGDVSTRLGIAVMENPVSRLVLESNTKQIRSGDVVTFGVTAFDQKGNKIEGITPRFSFTGESTDPSDYASGMVKDDGRFVGDVPGRYTVRATFAGISGQKTIQVMAREVTEKVQLIGRGAVSDVHTSDLWVWEGVDGRDYCVTGTWGGNGETFFWDVTDPANMVLIDTITVDARTVNDVKVSEDGKICVISREGASNRKNGIVIIDVSNPRDSKVISTFTDGLTGGVHNLFIYQDHVYALSNGERYDIINIKDPKKPTKVGEFELDGPGHSIHDVWIEDGIAYSSNWDYGVFMVDVGNGVAGGSPSDPKVIASYAYPSGWNHAAFPYRDKETGKFYVIAGDEAFPNGLHVEDNPTIPAGYLHFIDFTDKDNLVEVAKYEVPGAGSHNFWVDGDILYVANYNAGLRVVDISGDLMGDLYKQGREIAWFLPTDPGGRIANAPMTWGPQPHKGHIFFSDWNSGLWSVKVNIKKPENTKIESR